MDLKRHKQYSCAHVHIFALMSCGIQVHAAHPGFPQQGIAGGEQDDISVRGAVAVDRNFGDEYFAEDLRPIILFDGTCNLCNGGVQFVLDFDKDGVYRFASLQSDAGKALLQRCGRKAGSHLSKSCVFFVLLNTQTDNTNTSLEYQKPLCRGHFFDCTREQGAALGEVTSCTAHLEGSQGAISYSPIHIATNSWLCARHCL